MKAISKLRAVCWVFCIIFPYTGNSFSKAYQNKPESFEYFQLVPAPFMCEMILHT